MMAIAERLLSVLISTHKKFHLILSPSYPEDGVWESGLVGTCEPGKINPPHNHIPTTSRNSPQMKLH